MARDFDGGDVDFGNPAYLDLGGDQITLSIWVKLQTAGNHFLLSKWAAGQQSYLLETSGSIARFVVNAGGATILSGTTDIFDDVWHHVAGTYDGSTMRLYVDGVEESSVAKSGNLNSVTEAVLIGKGMEGCLGHGSIWDVGLSPGEVASLWEGVNPRQMRFDDLLLYAPLNGQSPEPDIVGGASGTVTGTTVIEEPPIPSSIVAPG